MRDRGIVVGAALEQNTFRGRMLKEAGLACGIIKAHEPHRIDALHCYAVDATRLDGRRYRSTQIPPGRGERLTDFRLLVPVEHCPRRGERRRLTRQRRG